ncbi:DUF6401 family natural product biosynthesis protein [Dactylosporangium sp. NPDC049525]|uniref:DUF6401 family natural product biosynthesis protein n=1 Tax=Dactylosporangium sp. NPDC049525 TaxID=3154730 RepID=UPI003421B7BE
MRSGFTGQPAGRPVELGGMFKDLAEATRHTAARSTLNGLMTWLGESGLAAAAASGGLQAAVDQHAASVRDALGDPEHGPNAIALASYATGVRDTLIDAQWQLPPTSELDWSKASWPTVRLIAICALARAGGHV